LDGEWASEFEDERRHLLEAFLDRVESRVGSEQGEPGGPDMGRDDDALGTKVGDHPDEGLDVEAQNRPAVGAEVAQPAEPTVDLLHRLEVGGQEEQVDLPDLAFLRIDEADLRREDERDVVRSEGDAPERFSFRPLGILQAEEAVALGLELLLGQKEPFRVGEIGRGQKGDALDLAPVGERVEGHVPRGRPGEPGVDMEIGDVLHEIPSQRMCSRKRRGIQGRKIIHFFGRESKIMDLRGG
jgi:hypothetical protein